MASFCIDFHTHTAKTAWDIQNCFPNSPPHQGNFSIGIHPWYISKQWETDLVQIWQKSQLPYCKAIGECGLDKNTTTDLNTQIAVFKQHIAISEAIKKPLILHCVKSFSEIIHLKKNIPTSQPWILHGFQKNTIVGNELLKNGIKISFGKALLFKNDLQTFFSTLNYSDFVLETDDSDIDIEEIYKKAAQIRHISLNELQKAMFENFTKFFNT